jgi:His-Xaa-Ser system radical SAM maturase HxsC
LRQLKGIPLNSRARIIGKVSKRSAQTTETKNYIYATESINKRIRGFRAVLCSAGIGSALAKQLKTPIVHSVENIEALNEGDIVSVDMRSGDIIVVYEAKSIHNSILASTDCNCRCIMCPQALTEKLPENLKRNIEIIRLIDKSTQTLGITGGEPLIMGEGLIKLLKECKKQLPKTQIQILTNGILLKNNAYVRRIIRLRLKKLIFCIPLYADTDREHDYIMQRNGAFEDTIQGLYTLATYKQLVEIRIVVMSFNFKRLPQIAEFIYRNFPFAIHVAFMGLEVEGQAKSNIKKIWASPVEYAPYLKEAVINLSRRNMDVSIYNEQLCLMPKEIWSFMRKSISEWKNTYLDICSHCQAKDECAGFFAQLVEEHKRLIKPL